MSSKKQKRIAVVASAWHYPLSFYTAMAKQKLPPGWSMDLFCISHRYPAFARDEKAYDIFEDSVRGKLDRKLYNGIATVDKMTMLGWKYIEMPNTIGDWGNTNQWFEHMSDKAKKYDLYLFTHDDNLIIHDRVIIDAIVDPNFKRWGICTNSPGTPWGNLRGSFEFFKPSIMKKLGWKFDLSLVTLDRTGVTSTEGNLLELNDWNNTVPPLMNFIQKNKVKIAFLSPCYRVSAYVIEGERGYISRTHGTNTKYEEAGLDFLKKNGII